MTNRSLPPDASFSDSRRPHRRFTHSVVAFASGLFVIPSALFALFRLVLGDAVNGAGSAMFWGCVCFGSVLAALIAWSSNWMLMWAAAAVGPLAVTLVLVVWAVLAYVGAA